MKKTILNLYYVLLPILIIGVSLGYTSFAMALAALMPLIFLSTRHTIAVFLVMYGAPLCGVIRTMYPILPLYGLVMEFLGFLLMWDLIRSLFRSNIIAIWGMLLTLGVFGVFYYMGPMTKFATTKYLMMCYHGLFMILGYYAFEKSSKIDVEGLTRLLLVASICMFTYLIHVAGMSEGGLIDYNWFREQFLYYAKLTDWEGTVITYQHVGMLVSFAVAVFLSQSKLKSSLVFFYLVCAIQLALVSGARQGIFGVLLVVFLRFTYYRGVLLYTRNYSNKLIGITLGLIVFGYVSFEFLGMVGSEVVSQMLQGETGRELNMLKAITLFHDNPITGCGIGGYQYITEYSWPHNMVLEILCETGIVGLMFSVLIIFFSLFIKKQGLTYVTSSGQFYFLILMAIFVRVMVSSDLRESIELFSAVFAITAAKQQSLKYRLIKTLTIKRFL